MRRIEDAFAKIFYGQAMLYGSIMVLEQEIIMIGNKLGVGDDEFPEQNAKIAELVAEVSRCADKIAELNEKEEREEKEFEESLKRAIDATRKSPTQAFSDLAPSSQEGGSQV